MVLLWLPIFQAQNPGPNSGRFGPFPCVFASVFFGVGRGCSLPKEHQNKPPTQTEIEKSELGLAEISRLSIIGLSAFPCLAVLFPGYPHFFFFYFPLGRDLEKDTDKDDDLGSRRCFPLLCRNLFPTTR
jgi:hypothetical protein